MGFLVKEILRRLCVEFGWAYAVFWKTIGCGDQVHLVWEDGHYERSSTASPASGFEAMDMLIKESGLLRSSQNGCQAEDRGRMLFKKMATQVHFIGAGVIGKAALTGNHAWVFGDDESISKGLLDINNQLCAGIKTIAIIPVLPHDIVQLGSSQMVHQNLGFINHVRALFEQLQFVPGTLLPSTTRRNLHQKIQPHETVGMQASFKHFGELGSDIFNLSNSRVVTEPYASSTEFYDQMLPNVSEVPLTKENMQSTMLPLKPHPMVHRATNPICQMNNPLETVSNSRKHYQHPTDLSYSRLTFLEEEPHSMSELANNFEPTFANTNILQLQSFGSTSLNPLQGSEIVSSFVRSPLLNCAIDLGKFNSFSSVPKSFKSNCADLSKTEVPQVLVAADHSIYNQMFTENFDPSHLNSIDHKSQSESSADKQKDSSGLFQLSSLQSSLENDLFDVWHLDQYKSGLSQCNLDEMEVGHVFNALNDEVDCNGMFSEAGSDQLLDAVVSQFNPGAKYEMDDDESCKTSVTKIRSSSLHTSSASPKKMHDETFGLPPVLIKSEPAAAGSMKSSCSMETNAGYKSQINLWIEDQKINRDNQSVLNGRKVELGKVNRKRSRPGENPRPRPKDRQMIQDRVKELREIIPNGAKCSIDALLEKTIKHMLFLHSVTKHADKLKATGEPKIISKEGGLLLKDNFEGGATWAFEVGSQSMICPIIVEDLNPPRQLLVEMLCEERGLFLEIADLVRGLGLTILKGVMEARNDKVWARFAVEANRDVTRMEVFISLVRLLKPSMASDKTLEGANDLNKPHDMFNSPSSIPATGSSDRLW